MRVSSHGGHNSIVQGANSGSRKEHLMDRECNREFISRLRSLGHSVEDDTDEVGRTANAIVGNQIRNINDRVNDVGFAWHLNASNGEGHGVEVLCYSQAEAPTAARISAEIAKRTGWKDRGAKVRPDIGVIRSSNCPFFLVEAGFIDNDGDMAKWNVDAITSAVIYAYFGQETQSTPQAPAPQQPTLFKVQTGGFAFSLMPEVSQAMTNSGVTGQWNTQLDGIAYVMTDRFPAGTMDKFTAWMDSKGWKYDYL